MLNLLKGGIQSYETVKSLREKLVALYIQICLTQSPSIITLVFCLKLCELKKEVKRICVFAPAFDLIIGAKHIHFKFGTGEKVFYLSSIFNACTSG